MFIASYFPPCLFVNPSSKLENKFPTLLTCIDFSLLRPPPSPPPSAEPVVNPLAWVGLRGTQGSRWSGAHSSLSNGSILPSAWLPGGLQTQSSNPLLL